MKYSQKTLHSSPERARYGVSFVSSKGNILCGLVKIELYKIFAIINRAIKGLHCMYILMMLASYFLKYFSIHQGFVWWGESPLQTWNDWQCINTLRPRQNGRRFADDTFIRIFLNENVRILIKISLKFVPEGPINNIPALVQIMAWRRSGDRPLSGPMMVSLPAHLCVIRPQWVNSLAPGGS